MKRSFLFFVILLALCGGSLFAQTKTVTNADLEKFRAERLMAEKEYRENYAKWGMPSPEELERRRVESAAELSERAERAQAESIQRERIDTERREQEAYYNYLRLLNAPSPRYSSPYVLNYYPYSSYRSRSFGGHRQVNHIPRPTLGPPRYDFLPGSILPHRRH